MNQTKYYVRVLKEDQNRFEEQLTSNEINFELLSHDWAYGKPSLFYSVRLNSEDALTLKLSFPLVGLMDFNKTLGKQRLAKI